MSDAVAPPSTLPLRKRLHASAGRFGGTLAVIWIVGNFTVVARRELGRRLGGSARLGR
jgi:hypothetical protein